MSENWIAYVGPFQFPWGQPGSRRVYGIASSLAASGHHVVVGSGEESPRDITCLKTLAGAGSLSYCGLMESPLPGSSFFAKALQLFYLCGTRTVRWLDEQRVKPSHVIVYGGYYAPYMYRLLAWCRNNHVPLIVDVVEWYDPSHMQGGYWGPFHMSAKFALKKQFPKAAGIIAISSYLASYYKERGCPVTIVPPTLDLQLISEKNNLARDKSDTLALVYAGTPGKKDLLLNVIQGISQIDPKGESLCLRVLGPTVDQVKHLLQFKEIPPFVQVLGRVDQSEVANILQGADFSVLLREPLRFAQAGFPTKFVESMANGTPVISNITSDLGQYLNDGVEGLICPDYTAEAFAVTLKRALQLTHEEIQLMRAAAKSRAVCSFDYRKYTETMNTFLEEVSL